jgi:hypothetical protein
LNSALYESESEFNTLNIDIVDLHFACGCFLTVSNNKLFMSISFGRCADSECVLLVHPSEDRCGSGITMGEEATLATVHDMQQLTNNALLPTAVDPSASNCFVLRPQCKPQRKFGDESSILLFSWMLVGLTQRRKVSEKLKGN